MIDTYPISLGSQNIKAEALVSSALFVRFFSEGIVTHVDALEQMRQLALIEQPVKTPIIDDEHIITTKNNLETLRRLIDEAEDLTCRDVHERRNELIMRLAPSKIVDEETGSIRFNRNSPPRDPSHGMFVRITSPRMSTRSLMATTVAEVDDIVITTYLETFVYDPERSGLVTQTGPGVEIRFHGTGSADFFGITTIGRETYTSGPIGNIIEPDKVRALINIFGHTQ